MDRRTFLAAGGAIAMSGLAARSWAADVPSAADLNRDIDIVAQALTLHPGLLRYQSARQMEERLARLRRDFVAASSIDGRFLALSAFTASIRCGHSYANFYNQKKAVADILFDRPTRLPFHFVWIGDQMVVSRDPSGQLPPGAEIRGLNGRPPVALRRRLMPLVRADGSNDAKRVSLLEVRGAADYETFDIFQGLIAPPPGGKYHIEARLPDRSQRSFELAAIGLKERQAARTPTDTSGDKPFWTWTVRPDGIAVLTMPSWAVYRSKWDWRAWLHDRLDSLAGAKGLIVDLRENEGGNDCGDPILARLIDRKYVPPAMQQRLKFQRTPAAIDRYLDTWDDSFRTMGVGARPLGNGFFERPGSKEEVGIDPAGKQMGVPVAVLVSPVNSSATFQFSSNFRSIGAGRLYGRSTGGNRRGINGGAYFFVRLPASGLEFDLPLVGYFPATPQPDAGLLPDVPVERTAADIARGLDPVMDRAASDLRRS